ncbi:MAG: ABC-type transport auxiliary lipoprotein family protein [Candidatus Binatia bacterium]
MNLSSGSLRYAVLWLAVFCGGCVALERRYPADKRYFMIEVQDGKGPSNEGTHILSVSNLDISPRYADRNFVYRTSETEYEADFYNQFLSAPATMISEEVRQALATIPLFKFVLGPSSTLSANYVLEGSINVLHGDFRNLRASAAVLEIEFFLHNEDSAKAGIVMQKRYRKSVTLSERSPEALVKGWNQALEEIIAMFVADLKRKL